MRSVARTNDCTANQQADVDDAIVAIVADPSLGEAKKGDLAGV